MSEQLESFDEVGAEAPHRETHFAEYWDILLKRRRVILLCAGLALIGGVVATVLTKPAYKAVAVLDVVKQVPNPVGFGASESGFDGEFLPSQIELMKSREIGERVVKKLDLLANPDFNPKHYGSYRPDAKGNAKKPSEDDIIDAAVDVQGKIDATIVRGTSLVQLTYDARTAQLAADIANAVAEAYIDWNVESRYRLVGRSSQFLAAQIEQAKAEVDAKEKELLAYGRQNEMVSVDTQLNPTVQKLDSLNRDLSSATADRVGKEAHYQEVQNTPADVLAESTSGGAVSQMRGDLQRMEHDYADKLNVYKPEWPAMQQLKSQIEQTRRSLANLKKEYSGKAIEAARSDYVTALRREQNLKALMKSQRTEALAEGSETIGYKNLRGEIDTKRALLDSLLKQQGETEVISRLRDQQMTAVRIVDRALPPVEPFKPSYRKNLLVSVFSGLFLGVGLAFVLSSLDRSLRTPEQVEQHLQLPALGVIPAIESEPSRAPGLRLPFRRSPKTVSIEKGAAIELLPHGEPRSAVSEAYRALRTSLLLSRAGGVRSVVVTSAFPQEGKSATAANLAVVLGQLGRRVLLVDADLHKPRIHEIFEVSDRVGLVSILAENVEPSRAIIKTSFPGVFVVPAGPETPNPSALLSSDAMTKFLELAATNFDHVVVDTPPVLLLSDTLVFAQQTDGVALCVRGGVTPREQVIRARDRIIRAGIPILGVVINALVREPGGYYYKPYGYDYERPREGGEPATRHAVQGT